jgi:hypothetical protein
MTDDFFDPLPAPSPPERYEPPVWAEPPPGELATLVPARRVLARTDRGVIVLLSHIDAFREGCSFRIRISAHRQETMGESEWYELHETAMDGSGSRYARSRAGVPDDLLRFGVQFLDGRKATTAGGFWFQHEHEHEPEPDGPLLTQHGGGGRGGDGVAATSWSLWLWPLPPAEPFDLVVAWPALGVDLTRVELSGRDIVEAASRAGPMWPHTPA